MPRLNRRPHRRRDDGQLTDLLREILESGSSLFGEEVEVDLGKAWERWGGEITERWVRLHPGTRPHGWWRMAVERCGPRQQVRPGPEAAGPADWLGIPALYRGSPPDDMFATERDYLARHGLLQTEEQQLLQGAGDLNDPEERA